MIFLTKHTPQRAIVVAVMWLGLVLVISHATQWPAPSDAPTETDIGIIGLASGMLVLFAILLVNFGQTAGALKTQSLCRLVARRFAPPAVAAVLTLLHTGRPGDAVAVLGAMLLATAAFGGTRYPLHLGGVARFVFDLLMPAAGISLALIAIVWGAPLSPSEMLVPLLGAWFVTFVGGWIEEAFSIERPVRLAMIAEPALARSFAMEMEATGIRDHRVVGWISESSEDVDGHASIEQTSDLLGIEWLGSADQIRAAVLKHQIDLLVMAPRGSAEDLFQETVERCVDLSVRMVQASYLYEEMYGRVPIGAINEAWFAYIMHPKFPSQAEWFKRLGDWAVSLLLLVVLTPLLTLVAIAVKLSDGGPVFFRQRRVGAHGHEFNVLKFRTMGADAENLGEARWAIPEDDRVTPVGRLLRKSHIDEIPQLINVVRGSMSLVGPRPERPEFVSSLEEKIPYYSRRVLVKPGITGWAQVRAGYAGSEVGTAFKLCHDLYYIKHRSFLFDLLTLIETARTVVADKQYEQFDFSEAFILGRMELSGNRRASDGRRALDSIEILTKDFDRAASTSDSPA